MVGAVEHMENWLSVRDAQANCQSFRVELGATSASAQWVIIKRGWPFGGSFGD